MADPATDCPPCPNGHRCGTPIRYSHRQDAGQWRAERGCNLWCPCCGEFWTGDVDAVLKAEMAYVAFEVSRG